MNQAKIPYNLTPQLEKRFHQFKKITDKDKRFTRIIELGKRLEEFPEEAKTESNQVHGCASLVYVIGYKENDKMHFRAWSNSHLVKGLLALLLEGMENQSPENILKIDPAFIEEMGLAQTLTASRANGFLNTFKKIMEITNKND